MIRDRIVRWLKGVKITKLRGSRYSATEEIVSFVLGGWLVVFLMFMMAFQIFSRYLFNYPFKGVSDLVCLIVVVITFVSLSGVQREKGHISMNLLADRLSGRWSGAVLELVVLLLMLVTTSFIFYVVLSRPGYFYKANAITEVLYIPQWPVAIVMPIGALLLLVRVCLQIKEQINIILKGEYITEQKKEISDL